MTGAMATSVSTTATGGSPDGEGDGDPPEAPGSGVAPELASGLGAAPDDAGAWLWPAATGEGDAPDEPPNSPPPNPTPTARSSTTTATAPAMTGGRIPPGVPDPPVGVGAFKGWAPLRGWGGRGSYRGSRTLTARIVRGEEKRPVRAGGRGV